MNLNQYKSRITDGLLTELVSNFHQNEKRKKIIKMGRSFKWIETNNVNDVSKDQCVTESRS